MMAAGLLNLVIEQGVTFGMTITVKDSTGTVINITGYTFRGSIKESAQDTAAVKAFTCTITDAVNGVFTVGLTDTETAALPATGDTYDEYSEYVYDIEMEDSGGVVTRLLNGAVSVSPEVTA